jgi:hypothetical protein
VAVSAQITIGEMAISRQHLQAALRMVEMNGGPQTLGLDGFLEMVLQKYAVQTGLTLAAVGSAAAASDAFEHGFYN